MKIRLKHPRILTGIVVTVAVVGLAGWFYHYNQTPAVGTIYHAPVPEPRTQAATITTLKSATISLQHPTHYSVENKAVAPPITEQYSLNMHQGVESRRVTVSVKTAVEPMTEDSAYKFRKLTVAEYEITDAVVDDQPAFKASKKDGSEITYFIPGQGRYVIIAATTINPKAAFAEEVTHIIDSFAWVR